jgi:hypothetical protein
VVAVDRPCPFRFAPAFEFYNYRVPTAELVEHLRQRAIEAGKMPASQQAKWWELHFEGDRTPAGYVVFPMTTEEFSQYGFLLNEWLHALAMELDPNEQRHFLTTYTRPDGRPMAPFKPADYIWADLYYVRNGKWQVAARDRIDEE